MKLPGVISDNQYLASSANAAVVDRDSGAYDKYLFAEQEIPEMPYETAVDEHLKLMSIRLHQRFSRLISNAQRRVTVSAARTARVKLQKDYFEGLSSNLDLRTLHHAQVLAGDETGRSGLFWIGEVPDFRTQRAAVLKLLSRYVIFLAIAAVDIVIIFFSFIGLGLNDVEAGFLTAPAVMAQLVFPHLVGSRLGLMYRGAPRTLGLYLEVLVPLILWGFFVFLISQIRARYILSLLPQADRAGLEFLFVALNLILLTALGGWLVFLAIRENHHEHDSLRLQLEKHRVTRKIISEERKLSRARAKETLSIESLKALGEELDQAINASRHDLGEAAKAVYRRALVNEAGNPDFTSSYLGTRNLETLKP
jgi:hypothetical protein